MQPVVHELSRANVKPQKLPHACLVVQREATVSKVWKIVDESCSVELQDEEIIPVVLTIDLFVLNPVCLYPCMFRQGMNSRQTDEHLSNQIATGCDRHHVKAPVISIIISRGGCPDERSQQQILERTHSGPRPLVQHSRIRRHAVYLVVSNGRFQQNREIS